MKKFLIAIIATLTLVACDSGGSSSSYGGSGSSSSSQPATRQETCLKCNGYGALRDYYGNIYTCDQCGGTGVVTVRVDRSNPSFGGGGKACTATVGCDCDGFDKVGAYGNDQFVCKHCGHSKTYHHKGRL